MDISQNEHIIDKIKSVAKIDFQSCFTNTFNYPPAKNLHEITIFDVYEVDLEISNLTSKSYAKHIVSCNICGRHTSKCIDH